MQKLAPEDWKHVLELLDTALELPAPEREAWLATIDVSRESLKPALRELLARHATNETDDFLQALPQFTRVELDVDSIAGELKPDADIGAYRLIRELGRGGMSAVWLAERIDGKFKRQVALKFPYAGPAQRELVERLRRERDILASLEHPNIARLYDADVTSSGQPFLVLEYVDGIAINEYCARQSLSVRERLGLFLQVFSAVQYAHAHLVMHRDLKPSNILVTADGVVHLLDFGIAKLMTASGVDATPLTEFGARALTPDYASPEQIAGRALTISTDIYSLGVVLYELLAGTRPYRLKRDSRASLEDAIAEADVIVPSRAVSDAADSRQLVRSLRGDLDTIVLKALAKNGGDRYATAVDMAEDVRRHLDGRPVKARPPTLAYRTQKFVGRYRWAVGVSAVAAVALIAALVVTVNASIEVRHERDLAARRFDDVRHLANVFLFDVDAKISDIPGTTEARQLLVNTGLGYLDRLSEQAGADVSLLREIARGYDKLGDVQGSVRVSNLGQTEAALVSYQKASALRQRPAIAQSTDPAFLREAAHGEQGLSEALFRAGRMSEARDHAATAVNFLTRATAVAAGPDQLAVQRERAEALIVYGFAIAVSGDMSGGLKPLRESVSFYEGLPSKQLDDPQFGRGYAFALFRTMQILGELPDKKGAAEALELASRVVAIDRRLLAGAPQQAGLRRGLARDLSKLGELLAMAGRHEEAVLALRESRRISEEDMAADPHDQLARRNVAVTRVHESDSLLALGRLDEARITIEPCVDDLLRMLAADGKNVTVGVNFVQASITYANVVAAIVRHNHATQDAQLTRAIGLLDQGDKWLEPLKPKLVGSDAEIPGRIATARHECAELLAHHS